MKLRILLLLLLWPALTLAQKKTTPGYLGQRLYGLWNVYTAPDLRHEPLPSLRWNLRNELSLGYALRPAFSTELQLGMLTTRLPYSGTDTLRSLETGGRDNQQFFRVNDYYVGLRVKYYLMRRSGAVAPVGLYAAGSVQQHWATLYEPSGSTGLARQQYSGKKMATAQGVALAAEVGNHWVVGSRLMIDLGLQCGLRLGSSYEVANESPISPLKKDMNNRLFQHYGLNVRLGVGYLL